MAALDQRWRKSTRSSANGACVEVRTADGAVEVRDSKHPSGPVLRFSPRQWTAFAYGLHGDEFAQ